VPHEKRVQAEEIQKLRKELSCTARELAATLGVEPREVSAWEAGELFPTKRHVTAMEGLRAKGPTAITRAPRGKAAAKTGQARLADPVLWRVVRKLVEHPTLFEQVVKLSESYGDPAEPAPPAAPKADG
jgi:transcriptional regulator with XRE-family HTH domain